MPQLRRRMDSFVSSFQDTLPLSIPDSRPDMVANGAPGPLRNSHHDRRGGRRQEPAENEAEGAAIRTQPAPPTSTPRDAPGTRHQASQPPQPTADPAATSILEPSRNRGNDARQASHQPYVEDIEEEQQQEQPVRQSQNPTTQAQPQQERTDSRSQCSPLLQPVADPEANNTETGNPQQAGQTASAEATAANQRAPADTDIPPPAPTTREAPASESQPQQQQPQEAPISGRQTEDTAPQRPGSPMNGIERINMDADGDIDMKSTTESTIRDTVPAPNVQDQQPEGQTTNEGMDTRADNAPPTENVPAPQQTVPANTTTTEPTVQNPPPNPQPAAAQPTAAGASSPSPPSSSSSEQPASTPTRQPSPSPPRTRGTTPHSNPSSPVAHQNPNPGPNNPVQGNASVHVPQNPSPNPAPAAAGRRRNEPPLDLAELGINPDYVYRAYRQKSKKEIRDALLGIPGKDDLEGLWRRSGGGDGGVGN